ncbi:MAG: hypothetical protein Q4B52_08090 [Tissierellia bacterium]|nr:hypothetical protein [Tissierellia bacterium]
MKILVNNFDFENPIDKNGCYIYTCPNHNSSCKKLCSVKACVVKNKNPCGVRGKICDVGRPGMASI